MHDVSPKPAMEPPVTVLYIGGLGRSGSTLLDLMLGQVPGFCAVGELSYVWSRADEDLCGCGRAFGDCDFWQRVGQEAFGGWDRIDRKDLARLRLVVDRNRRIGRLLRSADPSGPQGRYTAHLQALYDGVAAASGARVIVDSTKHLSTAFLVRRLPGVDLRIVHLIRDSRGVSFSWTKRVAKSWIADADAYMDRFPPAKTAARWVGYNVGFHMLAATRTPTIRMRYEDLIGAPLAQLRRALVLVGEPRRELPFLHGSRLELGEMHTVGGNAVRFGATSLELALDEGWREGLSRSQRLTVTALTSPLLAAYGYFGRRVV